MRFAYLSLGTNVGDRAAHLEGAIPTLAMGEPFRLSKVYQTEPVGGVEQDDFWNMVMEITTEASADELLERARRAEEDAGRTREVRWGPRTLDVDVLLVGDETRHGPELTLPHPRMNERAFVLRPLAELAPELVSDAQLVNADGRVEELGTLSSLR
ncbi:MAG: 2-amino-4-hydroxy-6-hydroxymethyldihydropteridine diphosphokinase [Acidimicrobiales bacterium]